MARLRVFVDFHDPHAHALEGLSRPFWSDRGSLDLDTLVLHVDPPRGGSRVLGLAGRDADVVLLADCCGQEESAGGADVPLLRVEDGRVTRDLTRTVLVLEGGEAGPDGERLTLVDFLRLNVGDREVCEAVLALEVGGPAVDLPQPGAYLRARLVTP